MNLQKYFSPKIHQDALADPTNQTLFLLYVVHRNLLVHIPPHKGKTVQTTTLIWLYFLQMKRQLLTMKTLPKCFNLVNKLWRWKDTILDIVYFVKYYHGIFGKIWIRNYIYIIFQIFYHSFFACLAFRWRVNITSHSPNPPPLLFGEALVAREPKDRTFFTDPDNIGVEILVLSSVDLISNIGLLTAEALTGEPNEKDPTFNK